MQQNQVFSPKYWVIHDKLKDDVILWTAAKCKNKAIENFIYKGSDALERYGNCRVETVEELFYEDDNIEAVLIEINFACSTVDINK